MVQRTLAICVVTCLACTGLLMADTYKNPNFKYVGRTKQYHKDSGKIGLGTCTLISKNWILTAYHVAQFRKENPNGGRFAVYFRGSSVESTVRNVYKAPGVDVALCEIKPAISADGVKGIPPVALMSGKFTDGADGTITFTMIGHQGGLHYHRNRKGHGTNGGESFYHSKDANGNRPGKAGDSGGAWVIERTGSTITSQDVQFAVIHGGGTGPQVGPLKDWINNKIADINPGQTVTWVTKSHTKNGTPSDVYTWTGYASSKTWKKLGNWSPNGTPGVDGSADAADDVVAELAWMGNKSEVYAEPKLENSWSLGQIMFSADKDHDMSICNSNDWNPSTGDGRKRILLNGKDSTAFNVESDTDGTFTYTIEEGIRILVDNDLYWDVYGDETLRIEGRVNGTGRITKRGSGTLTFANTGEHSNNNGTNPLDILGGTVIIGKEPNIPNIGADVLVDGADAVLQLDTDEQITDTATVTIRRGLIDFKSGTETVGGLVLEDDGVLAFELGGAEAGEFGQVIVSDAASLEGTLKAACVEGFSPSHGDLFRIVAADSYEGAPVFDFAAAPLPAGLYWDTTGFAADGTIRVGGIGSDVYTGRLDIQNYTGPSNTPGLHITMLGHGATEGYDEQLDQIHDPALGPGIHSEIVSIIPPLQLSQDARPLSNVFIDLELSLHWESGEAIEISDLDNELRVRIDAAGQGWAFGNKPITLWERDANEPNDILFVADIREAIASNAGVIPLERLDGTYESVAAYALLQVRFDTFPGDFDFGGTVDLADVAYIGSDWRRTDSGSLADIAGPNGIPDGTVDYFDLRLLGRDYLKDANDPNTW